MALIGQQPAGVHAPQFSELIARLQPPRRRLPEFNGGVPVDAQELYLAAHSHPGDPVGALDEYQAKMAFQNAQAPPPEVAPRAGTLSGGLPPAGAPEHLALLRALVSNGGGGLPSQPIHLPLQAREPAVRPGHPRQPTRPLARMAAGY